MEHIAKKIPQKIKEALKEIGELSTLFYLYYKFNTKGWSVFRNYDKSGYDILLFNENNGRRIKIEVKTRQRIVSSIKNKSKITHFTLSESEKNSADYLVAYWLEHKMFFIVPTSRLKEAKSNEKKLYKFIVSLSKNNEPNPEAKQYLDKWDIIEKE